MTEEELRRILQDAIVDKNRRAEDKKQETQIAAIAAYTALAGIVGGLVLWISDARIEQKNKPLSDKQIVMEKDIETNKASILEIKKTNEKIINGIDELKDMVRSHK